MFTIAIDAMGGDNAPKAVVEGAVNAVSELNVNIILVGIESGIKKELLNLNYTGDKITICNATQIITNEESPTVAIKQKKDSSIVKGLKMLKEKGADAFISAGSTGALLTGATVMLGRIKGIERPALATVLPNKKGFSLLIDCGANVDAKPSYLVQFAKMGSVYSEHILKKASPKVAMVNVGAEKEKGNELTKTAYPLLEEAGINFAGNIEARDIAEGTADVIVCDAFTGNVILKYAEGLSSSLFSIIKSEITSTFLFKIGALILKPAFKNISKRFDYTEYGGAPFLGLNSLVVKAHGSSNAKAIKNAVKQCLSFCENDITGKISNIIAPTTILRKDEENGI